MSVFPLFFRLAVRVQRRRSPSQDHRLRLSALALGALLCLLPGTGRAADPAPADAPLGGSLTLAEAERLALSRYPTLAQSAAEIEAARARAIYAGQLQDPQLRLGVEAVPIDSFALNRESMTQVVVGVTQMFPPTGRLALNRRSAEQATAAARARREDLAAQIRRDVRRAWLELFYQERALATLRVNRELYDQVVRAALAQYRTGRAQEADVLKAQLERDELLDQEQTLLAERDAARSRLARLLSLPETALTLPEALPPLPPLPARQALLAQVAQHPQAAAMEAEIRARELDVAAAKRDYYPEFGLEASYGYRAARADGQKLPDMVSAGLVMSLPLFTAKRQDARLQERQAQARALRYEHDDMLLQLREEVNSRYAAYERLRQRVKVLEDTLLPEARQTVDSSLAAYRVGRLDMTGVLRARQSSLDYALRLWRARTDLAGAAADLHYLAATAAETEHEH
ncbi:TolC family protein [Thermithiobacillus tepidarius DSM 3134]|uniref:TolC family protein n=1 Tax=Thermithiobacillus tepidarius TaxID=929 RepID=UPI0003FA632E|nr:TolC family protein [Thermithiobacillus tepidarius]